MCIVFFSYKTDSKYKFILAANRDEFYARPTLPVHFWTEHPEVYAGKDLEKGGTWLGITKEGKISWTTNFREPIKETYQTSRGNLVLDYLVKREEPSLYLTKLEEQSNLYAGFNLFAGSIDELFYYSNRGEKIEKLESGIYGISNHFLNTPWPKVKTGKERFSDIISKAKFDPSEFFNLLSDTTKARDEDLPNTGIGAEIEKMLSPIFIKSELYGTRSQTVILADKDNLITVYEKNLKESTLTGIVPSRMEFQIIPNHSLG